MYKSFHLAICFVVIFYFSCVVQFPFSSTFAIQLTEEDKKYYSLAGLQENNLEKEKLIELEGTITLFWVDFGSEFNHNENPLYYLITDNGNYIRLNISNETIEQMDGISFSDPQKVHITGTVKNSDFSDEQIIDVQTLTPLSDTIEKDKTTSQETIKPQEHVPLPPTGGLLDNNHISGSQKYITILCRFGDFADFTPKPSSEVQDLLDRVDNYWQEVSYNRANFEGSEVTGWYNLPDTRAGYAGSFPGGIDLDKFTTDCIDQADPEIFFPDFDGIILLVNTNLFGAFGGFGSPAFPFNRDGEIKNYKFMFLSSDGWHNQDIFTHEVAHTFSLPHSSGPYGMVYDSNWDVLSSTEDCKNPEPEFRCEGPHTIAFHKYVKGWIDDSRTYIANSSPDQVIFLERLAEPGPNGNLLALIPIGNSNTDLYSIESRKSISLDKEIPDNGVLINKINLALPETPVQVVDTTFNANPNDKGAIWTPGEIFKDNINNISIKILKETPTGFWVVINPTLWTTIWEEIFDL